jgi:hypothetical protein
LALELLKELEDRRQKIEGRRQKTEGLFDNTKVSMKHEMTQKHRLSSLGAMRSALCALRSRTFFALAFLAMVAFGESKAFRDFLEPVAMAANAATNAEDAAAAVKLAEKAVADAGALTGNDKVKKDAAVAAAAVYLESAKKWVETPDDAEKKAAALTTASMAESTLAAAKIPCTQGDKGCCEQGSAANEAEKPADQVAKNESQRSAETVGGKT